uniref:Haloacid dehalogenase-like hydrolase domain-containing protein 3 n=2 Tax=Hemiselmis andersenii TaxID=464988 RepID=A0A7S1DFQ4_HEMAN|mmetsp:Transcript_11146/g.26946  ORF Transcript_11146/g.26946 Transcript_11146/m.26946 type:complete len:286 (+) Transcript_11146:60-917(+)
MRLRPTPALIPFLPLLFPSPLNQRLLSSCRPLSTAHIRLASTSSASMSTSMTASGRVIAVTFDLDDTLWDCLPPLKRANAAHIEHMRENYPKVEVDADKLRAEMLALRELLSPEEGASLTILRRKTIERLAERAGYAPEEVADSTMEVFMRERNKVDLFEGAVETLQQLRGKGLVVGAVTNGNADVARTPLKGLFDFSVLAGALGFPKPHPASFLEAAKLSNASPGQLVHVGDDFTTDIVGARAAGVRSVWYNPKGAPRPEGAAFRPDGEVAALAEVVGLVDGWR